MKTCLFSVYDSAARRYKEPFYAPTPEYAERMFRQTVNSPGNPIHDYPEDYTLFHVADFNQETGVIEAVGPFSLGVAIVFKAPDSGNGVVEDFSVE